MMQKKNKPIVMTIDTGGQEINLQALLNAIAQKLDSTPQRGYIRLAIAQRGLHIQHKETKVSK